MLDKWQVKQRGRETSCQLGQCWNKDPNRMRSAQTWCQKGWGTLIQETNKMEYNGHWFNQTKPWYSYKCFKLSTLQCGTGSHMWYNIGMTYHILKTVSITDNFNKFVFPLECIVWSKHGIWLVVIPRSLNHDGSVTMGYNIRYIKPN